MSKVLLAKLGEQTTLQKTNTLFNLKPKLNLVVLFTAIQIANGKVTKIV